MIRGSNCLLRRRSEKKMAQESKKWWGDSIRVLLLRKHARNRDNLVQLEKDQIRAEKKNVKTKKKKKKAPRQKRICPKRRSGYDRPAPTISRPTLLIRRRRVSAVHRSAQSRDGLTVVPRGHRNETRARSFQAQERGKKKNQIFWSDQTIECKPSLSLSLLAIPANQTL